MCLRKLNVLGAHMLSFVSLIIITKNNATTIEDCITSILHQTYPRENFETIFVDGHSIDGTVEIIKKYVNIYPFMKIQFEDHGTMGYARNVGINVSKGEILVFTDGDAVLPNYWLSSIVKCFDSPTLAAVGGFDVLVNSGESGKLIDSWRRLKKTEGLKAISCIKTVNFAIRRDCTLSCGGFDPKLSHWDEAELLARLYSKSKKINILYDPKIVVYHKRGPSKNLVKKVRRTFRKSLIGTSVLMRKHMVRVAITDPVSPIGISFLFVPICIVGIFVLVLSLATGMFVTFLKVSLSIYIIGFSVYLIKFYLRTHKFNFSVPLTLTLDFFVRVFGTFFGFFKWLKSLINIKK